MKQTTVLNQPVHILGAGGIGVALAWCLVRGGCTVTVVEARTDKVKAGREEGLTVSGYGTVHPEVVGFDEWRPPAGGLVLLCTKTYDNPAVLARLPGTAGLVPVQNGFDPVLDRERHSGEGVASFVSECRRDRPVTRITRSGCLHLGPRREVNEGERSELAWLAAALGGAGLFPVKWVQDVRPYKAAKLMYNAAISPLAAAAGMDKPGGCSLPCYKRIIGFCGTRGWRWPGLAPSIRTLSPGFCARPDCRCCWRSFSGLRCEAPIVRCRRTWGRAGRRLRRITVI